VFASDSRTNAGVDYVATHSKMTRFLFPNDRSIYILTAGSLATSQAVLNQVESDLEDNKAKFNLSKAKYMHEIAQYVGELSQAVQIKHERAMEKSKMSAESSANWRKQIRQTHTRQSDRRKHQFRRCRPMCDGIPRFDHPQ